MCREALATRAYAFSPETTASPISRLNLNFGQQVRDTPERAIDGWSTDVKTFCVDHCGESRKN